MAERVLDGAQIAAVLQQMGREEWRSACSVILRPQPQLDAQRLHQLLDRTRAELQSVFDRKSGPQARSDRARLHMAGDRRADDRQHRHQTLAPPLPRMASRAGRRVPRR